MPEFALAKAIQCVYVTHVCAHTHTNTLLLLQVLIRTDTHSPLY